MIAGRHLEEVDSRFHETPSLVLSVRTLAGFQGQHNAHVFHCRRRSVNFREIRACIHCRTKNAEEYGNPSGSGVLEVASSLRHETPERQGKSSGHTLL